MHILIISFSFILVFSTTACCDYEHVDSLPTSVNGFSSGSGTAVLWNDYAIYLSTDTGTVFRPIELPTSVADANALVIDGVVSHGGTYLYFVFSDHEGVYRLDLTSREWDPIKPVSASGSVSALHLGNDGSIWVGTEGLIFTNESVSPGIYRSTNQGESWEQIEFSYEGLDTPGVVAISADSTGSIIISGRGFSNTAPSGTYLLNSISEWHRVSPSIATSVIAQPTHSYFLSDELVTICGISENKAWKRVLWATYGAQNLFDWEGAAIGVFNGVVNDSLSVLIFDDSVVVDTMLVKSSDMTSEKYFVTSSELESKRKLFVSGGGDNLTFDLNNVEVHKIYCTPPFALITHQFASEDFNIIHVDGHGWYSVDTSLVAQRTRFLDGILDKVVGNQTTFDKSTILVHDNRRVYRVHHTFVDTVFKIPDTLMVYSVCAIEDDLLGFATNSGNAVLNTQEGTLEFLSQKGWPVCDDQSGGTALSSAAMLTFKQRLFAWAQVSGSKLSCLELGGLYEYRDDLWIRVDGQKFERRTRLEKVVQNIDRNKLLFDVVEPSLTGNSLSTIASYDTQSNETTLLSDNSDVLSEVTAIAALGDITVWFTNYGHHVVVDELGTKYEGDDLGIVASVGLLGSGACLFSARVGFVFSEYSRSTTAVTNLISLNKQSVSLVPNPCAPENRVQITLPCCEFHDIDVCSATGHEVLLPKQLLSIDSRNIGEHSIVLPRHLSHGLYLVSLIGSSCSHVGFLVVN